MRFLQPRPPCWPSIPHGQHPTANFPEASPPPPAATVLPIFPKQETPREASQPDIQEPPWPDQDLVGPRLAKPIYLTHTSCPTKHEYLQLGGGRAQSPPHSPWPSLWCPQVQSPVASKSRAGISSTKPVPRQPQQVFTRGMRFLAHTSQVHLSSWGPHTALGKTDWTRFPFTVFYIFLRGPKINLGEKQIWASFTFCQYGDEEGKVQLKRNWVSKS